MEQQLLDKIKTLESENEKLKFELDETKKHLKKYTCPERNKKFYEEHKEELLEKMKLNPITKEKRKEYNKKYYLNKKNQKDI